MLHHPKTNRRPLRRNSPIASALLLAFALTGCASLPDISAPMPVDRPAAPPSGLVSLCELHPDICGLNSAQGATPSAALDAAPTASITIEAAQALKAGEPPAVGAMLAPEGEKPKETAATPKVAILAAADADAMAEASDAMMRLPEQTIEETPRLDLTAKSFAKMRKVNRLINAKLRPATDLTIYGRDENWTLPLTFATGNRGDCEDYALEKRHALVKSGVPSDAMYFAVGTSLATGRHAVLIVSTTTGDYVLDNMTSAILPWRETNYDWISRQMPHDWLSWSTVGEPEIAKIVEPKKKSHANDLG